MKNILNQIKNRQAGFTIVELLVVIVVIGILASITIVAYTGVTNRAYAAAGKANGLSVAKVADAYAADSGTGGGNGNYPTLAQLQGYNGVAKIPAGVTTVATTLSSAQVDGKTILYVPKSTTGACIGYWDGSLATPAVVWTYVGNAVTGSNAATPTCV